MKINKGILTVISALAGAAAGAGIVSKKSEEKLSIQKAYTDKHLSLYLMMNQWVKIKQENKSIADYLAENGYREIAVYGMNYVGQTLLNELAGSSVKVRYGIDKNASNIYSDIDIVLPEEKLERVDAVIVTPITFFDGIEEALSKKLDCPILSMEDILYEV